VFLAVVVISAGRFILAPSILMMVMFESAVEITAQWAVQVEMQNRRSGHFYTDRIYAAA